MSNTGFDLTVEVLEGMAVGYLAANPGLPVPPFDLGWESKQLTSDRNYHSLIRFLIAAYIDGWFTLHCIYIYCNRSCRSDVQLSERFCQMDEMVLPS